MDRYIHDSKHKGILKAMLVLAMTVLVCVLIDIILFVVYTLKLDGEADSYYFFASILLAVIGMVAYSAAEIAFTTKGNYSYYKFAFVIFIIADISNVVYDIQYIVSYGFEIDGFFSLMFYAIIDSVNLLFNLILIRFVFNKGKRKFAIAAATGEIIIILFYLYDIIKAAISLFNAGELFNSKAGIVNTVSNFIMLIITVSSLLFTIAKPHNEDVKKINVQ